MKILNLRVYGLKSIGTDLEISPLEKILDAMTMPRAPVRFLSILGIQYIIGCAFYYVALKFIN